MAVLSADLEFSHKDPGLKSYPAAVDILYKGGFALINESGYAVAAPVAASAVGHKFAGVSKEKVDNSAGSAGDKEVKVYTEGLFLFTATSITQAMVGQMMYLVDDQTFDDVPGAYAIPVGILAEYVSVTQGWIDIGPAVNVENTPISKILDFVTKTDDYTVLAKDSGKTFAIATDAKTFTLPSTSKGLVYRFVNTGADGNNIITISPAAADRIGGGGLGTGEDNKDLINTKATAKYGDLVELVGDGADGWVITQKLGTWAKEA